MPIAPLRLEKFHEKAKQFGLIKIDKTTFKIVDFEEKPVKPTSNLASIGVYMFNWSILKDYLKEEEQIEYTQKDFCKDIISAMLKDEMRLYAYYFNKYWSDKGTSSSYKRVPIVLKTPEEHFLVSGNQKNNDPTLKNFLYQNNLKSVRPKELMTRNKAECRYVHAV